MMSPTRSPRLVLAGVVAGAALFGAAVVAQQAPANKDVTAAPAPPATEAPTAAPPATEAPVVKAPVVSIDKGATAFLDVYRVLLHPRCMNCHPKGDVPLQTDDSIPHAMNIRRDSRNVGLPCSTCHRETMPNLPHQPPGLPTWHMPPKETPMVFEGKTPAQLCAQLKKPEETAGKDLDGLVHHVEHDALVHYGWNPGPGRTLPPISHEDFVLAFQTWVRAGAPCPHDDVRVDVKKSATRPSPR